MIPIISVVGKTNVGKTTFIEQLIRELKTRGYRIATIKHDVHKFEIDHKGKDTWRHTQAGADTVIIASSSKMAMIKKIDREYGLDELQEWLLQDVDLIITEGYKRKDKPKIEISRKAVSQELLCRREELLAIVSDQSFTIGVPIFDLEDASGVADLIEEKILTYHKGG
ncbi:MAG TPA: molybdopterin-guanine dinucleotide biosynthesis protein B [Proteobacteria bacterium]|nr:molybdopterin-guanine dinucleotide biosynthesis protein B [Pseudomonadota bacterium]